MSKIDLEQFKKDFELEQKKKEKEPVFHASKKIIEVEREHFYGGQGSKTYLKNIRNVIESASKEIIENED